ncbi:MAG: metallophosphoesterase family protein [Candidatus Eisenbacteria bacterium]|nr:metallophosphoesterase family protein [Candidatus Eisenbacteria bacterium]
MPQDKAFTRQRLSDFWSRGDLPVLDIAAHRFAVLSDFHLGNGRRADDFHHNEETLSAALAYYHQDGYSLILLGDIEELWQFDLTDVLGTYGETIYERLRCFGQSRIHRVFGNHDIDLASMSDPLWAGTDQSAVPEAIKLSDERGVPRILLAHGHQGSAESDRYSRLSRSFVRAFRFVEPFARSLGLYRNPITATSQIAKTYEKIMHEWARDARVLLVCGHSHRALFASRSYADRIRERIVKIQTRVAAGEDEQRRTLDKLQRELRDEIRKGRDIEPTEDGFPLPCYFNCGCGLYTDGITALEIDTGEIRLVKWNRDQAVTPRREIYQRGNLFDFLAQIERASGTVA